MSQEGVLYYLSYSTPPRANFLHTYRINPLILKNFCENIFFFNLFIKFLLYRSVCIAKDHFFAPKIATYMLTCTL